MQSTHGLAAVFARLSTAVARLLTASGSAGFVDCGCGEKSHTKQWLFWPQSEGTHFFLCSLPLRQVTCTLGGYCPYAMGVGSLVFIRLNTEYNFAGSVLRWIWMNCSVINEVAFTSDCFPLHNTRPFTVKSSFFSCLWGPELWRYFCTSLKSNANYV